MRLYFDAPNWYDQLRANFDVWGNVDMERVGVRFNGNSSYQTYPGNKKSFKIKTNEYVKGRRIENIDTLNLNNAFKDPSMQGLSLFFTPRPPAQKLWEVPEYCERYLAGIREMTEGVASHCWIAWRDCGRWLEPWVELEKRSMFTLDQFRRALAGNIQTGSATAPRFLIPGIEPFVRARALSIREQLP